MSDDITLAEATPSEPTRAPFGDPDGAPSARPLTIEDVLGMARRVEKIARVCLRADLAAEREQCSKELAGLVDAEGRLLTDDEASMGDAGNADRAQALADRIKALGREMAGAMWSVRFQAMSSDDWEVFQKEHFEKARTSGDFTDYNRQIIAATAIQPTINLEQTEQLRKTLGPTQWKELADTAWQTCTSGGVDVPKSPISSLNLTRAPSETS